jgi:hypothetical protein
VWDGIRKKEKEEVEKKITSQVKEREREKIFLFDGKDSNGNNNKRFN